MLVDTIYTILSIVFWVVIGITALIIFFQFWFIVHQQNDVIIERFGKYARTVGPGLRFKIPIIERVVGKVNLRILQKIIKVDTKTKDNVFVDVHVSVQYRVVPGKSADSYYQLQDITQIDAYALDLVRGHVPSMELDHLYEHKDTVASAVRDGLNNVLPGYGYTIITALVTDISPDKKVQESMNEIQASTRMLEAVKQKAEADKVRLIKAAEAEAQSKELQGQGIARQRQAIVDGLKQSVSTMTEATGINNTEVLKTIVLTQFFDTIRDAASGASSKVIFIPYTPDAMKDISAQLQNAILTASEAK